MRHLNQDYYTACNMPASVIIECMQDFAFEQEQKYGDKDKKKKVKPDIPKEWRK